MEKNLSKDKATDALQRLIVESEGNPIMQVAAARVCVPIFRTHYSFLDENVTDLSDMDEAADKATLHFSLALELEWERYYRSLRWYKKSGARKARDMWLAHEAQRKEAEAVSTVHAIIETHFPEAMNLPAVKSVFTKQDLDRMQAGNNGV